MRKYILLRNHTEELMRLKKTVVIILALMLLLTACGKKKQAAQEAEVPQETPTAEAAEPTKTAAPAAIEEAYVEAVEIEPEAVKQEVVILAEPPQAAIPDILEAEASGELVKQNEKAQIDYSNTADGYIMVLYTADSEKKLKTQIVGPETTYTYNLEKGEWAVFPLTDGEGGYQFKVFENVKGSQYSLVIAEEADVVLSDEFAPFLRPNQYVDYGSSSKAVELAWELTKDIEQPLEKVTAVYDYVVRNLAYDYDKASSVTSGYVPVLDTVLEEKKGICFDYAALMTGMLRSQGIPCKMVFGYAGTIYHAWISVWTEDTGWVDGVIFFDGTTWQRLDPTFAASALEDESILDYIGDGSNYKEKYLY